MRQETNNEIDLLLRRLSRRGDGGARDGETRPGEQHLDVDEMSSYAQNAVPAKARARYTEHLAECTTCRKLVTELSLSLGAATAAASAATVVESSGLKKFLASLFSPLVLRYAVPALGVIVVMVVGLVVLRRQDRNDFVAQVEVQQNRSVPEAVQPGSVEPAIPSDQGEYDSGQRQTETEQNRVAQTNAPKRDSDTSAGVATGAGEAPLKKRAEESVANEAPVVATAAPAPAAPKAAVEDEGEKHKKAETDARKQSETAAETEAAAKVQASSPGRERFLRSESVTTDSVTASNVREVPRPQGRFESLQTLKPGTSTGATNAKDETGTRGVAGRKFRKERGIWIDTAYDSSTRTVNLARGSEQFRALVADEPAIKTIAEELDGEVIVVWKGRAYRIR